MIDCSDPSCVAIRIHDNLEYMIVPPSNWSANDPIPDPSPTWGVDFDPAHEWDVFEVFNATTEQIEFSPLESDVTFDVATDCQIYGYRYLALGICLKYICQET